ncbi:MAG: hypothetical protein DI600_07355, partial [Cutibacterium granulosum]
KLSNLRYGGSAYGYGYSKYDSNYRASTDKTPRTDSTTSPEDSGETHDMTDESQQQRKVPHV